MEIIFYTVFLHLQLQNKISFHADFAYLFSSVSLIFLGIGTFNIKKSLATLPHLIHEKPQGKKKKTKTNKWELK